MLVEVSASELLMELLGCGKEHHQNPHCSFLNGLVLGKFKIPGFLFGVLAQTCRGLHFPPLIQDLPVVVPNPGS